MKYISYSLFGYGKREHNCFDFSSYLRGMWINIRLARCIYPDCRIHICVDKKTFEHFESLFNRWKQYNVVFKVLPTEPLCKAMLWRLLPIFEYNVEVFIFGAFMPFVNIAVSIILLFNYFAYRFVR